MGLNRRTFLQRAGLAMAALGVSETLLSLLVDKSLAVPVLDRYLQALAQPGGRKLALLVGINQYPKTTALGGCITDVELQRELLIHRFGFNPSDVLTLTDSQATRENIETAFLEHLTEQAKPGDVVVFHFSGYGSRVKLSEEFASEADIIQNSLVPVDGWVPSKGTPVANDLLEDTLIWLMRSLATERVTAILDTSHTSMGSVLQGNLRVRSLPNPPAETLSAGELAFQEQLLRRLKSSRAQLKSPNILNPIPGIVLTAAGPHQLAAEALWNGFSAGLFTYALTQHLWQATPATTVQVHLSRAAGMVNQLAGSEQQPQLIGQKSLPQPLLAYYLPADPSIGSDGVVTAIEDNGQTVQLWLAGLPATVLEYYGVNSVVELVKGQWSVVSEEEQTTDNQQLTTSQAMQLQIRSKEGLMAKARLIGMSGVETNPLQVGQLVQESIRLLPRNLGLTIALDTQLERIERVDATSAFATIPYVSSVVIAGEQPADYLFGKVASPQALTPNSVEESANSTPVQKSSSEPWGYGLFYLVRNPIRNTVGETGEAVKSAVNRLTSKLQTLLAAKLLRLTANEGSSRLGIRASLEMM
ncbi:MAG TPA: caspase family protein, partial [Cyanophyceae cyanobacterium]